MIASTRCLDRFARVDGEWFLPGRRLTADRTETRPGTP